VTRPENDERDLYLKCICGHVLGEHKCPAPGKAEPCRFMDQCGCVDFEQRREAVLIDDHVRLADLRQQGRIVESSRASSAAPNSVTKYTNPKDAIGIKKAPMSVLPQNVLAEVGLALLEGALKYGRHNYRSAGVRASVYFDALHRHTAAFWEGEDTDPDSGLSHVTKAIATLVVLRDSMLRGNWTDDRPPACEPGWQRALNELAAALIEKYPNPVPAHVQRDYQLAVNGQPIKPVTIAVEFDDRGAL